MDYVGMDIFQLEGYSMLLATDYYSNFIWMTYIVHQTSVAILEALMLICHCHSYPRNMTCDESHNMASCEIYGLCKAKDINTIRNSPYNPASNGKAECAMKMMKSLFKEMWGNSVAFSEALLAYHDTQ